MLKQCSPVSEKYLTEALNNSIMVKVSGFLESSEGCCDFSKKAIKHLQETKTDKYIMFGQQILREAFL